MYLIKLYDSSNEMNRIEYGTDLNMIGRLEVSPWISMHRLVYRLTTISDTAFCLSPYSFVAVALGFFADKISEGE